MAELITSAHGRAGTQHRDIMMKSQSAMEYLMTYGWAILIIAVVLSVLFQLGVFSSGNFQPHAQAGACQVSRTVAGVSLEGQCNGLLPQYVAGFNNAQTSNIMTPLPTTATYGTTISAWFYQTGASDIGGIFYLGSTPEYPNSNGYGLVAVSQSSALCSNTAPEIAVLESSLGWDCFSALPYNIDRWNNVVLVTPQNGANVNYDLYLNGVSTAINNVGGGKTPQGDAIIGGTTEIDPYQGYISNVQLYNTTLSPSEVQALYLEGIGGAPIRPQNLVGWWPLNGNANDYSGNNNNGQLNSVTFSSSWESGYTAP